MNRMCRTALCFALSVVMSIMAFPAASWAQVSSRASSTLQALQSIAVQDEDYDISWYINDSQSDEFGINTEAQLRGLAELVNGTAEIDGAAQDAVPFQGKTIYLEGSLSLTRVFTPIGTPDHPFAGTFAGQDHAIRGLRVDSFTAYAGLFGYVSEQGALRGIRLENASLAGGETSGIVVATESDYVGCVGSLAGQCDGAVVDCSSDVAVTVESSAQATEQNPYIVQRVGGLVGYARGDISSCSYTGTVNAQVMSDTVDADSSSDSLRVADSFGGIVGRFGDPDRHGTLCDSWNEGDVVVQTYGAGAKDRFGTVTYANSFFIGGVAGYSNGSVMRCHNGAYNADTREVTGRVFTGVYKSGNSGDLADNRGADQVGGIVGGLRSVSDNPDRYNDGDPDDPTVVADCYNEAQITGLCGVGGIVGEAGVYCSVTRCYNGTITDLSDWTRNQISGKVVSTRWNKPMTGGIAGHLWSSDISYCANYAEIRNVQTGYYTAGIVGCQFMSDDYPNATGEIYACFNSGGVYTVNTVAGIEYREAGILGQNEGYVHDCIVMKGSVPYHRIERDGELVDAAIGANDWGAYDNLFVKSSDELASSASAALLNVIAAQKGDWSCYWFVNRKGYPVLNTWADLADSERTLLTRDLIKSAVQVAPAPWMGEGTASVPMLEVTLTDGTVLVQNADFLVVPQAGAWEMSAGGRYLAGITGIGVYRGTVNDCASYDIGACDLSQASVYVSSKKFAFGHVVFPTEVLASIGGAPISSSEVDYIIYNSATSANAVRSGKGVFPVYDSAGYISYTPDGSLKKPVADIGGGIDALNAETRDWWLYDRNFDLISDSAGNSYYTSTSGSSAGRVYGANTSCVNLKSGSPAGYVVQMMPHEGSSMVTGKAIGYYVIEPVNLYRECTFEGAVYDGRTWKWDPDRAKFFTESVPESSEQGASGDEGATVRDYNVSATFTGESICPVPTVSYGDYTLIEGVDYRISYGDPDPADGGAVAGEGIPNRNVTTAGTDGTGSNSGGAESGVESDGGSQNDDAAATERAGMVILPQNTSNMSNYIVAYFDIEPAALADCEVGLASSEWAYTGDEVKPPVVVTLNGVILQEGVDYEIEYRDNTQKGTAGYTVRSLANLSGGELHEVSGEFQITDGVKLDEAFTLGPINDQQFNWGYDVHPALTFNRIGMGEQPEEPLVEGVDYTVVYSKKTVTKWPSEGKSSDPCTVTVTGTGKYTGQLSGSFHIVPYDANQNATGQLKAFLQDLPYGMWGYAPTGERAFNGETLPTDALVNVGLAYPVMMVQARPVVNWAVYDAAVAAGVDLDESGCYGDPITLSTSNNNVNGGLVARYPVRYYDADDAEVNGNGGVYYDANGALIARPAIAQPGTMSAKVWLRCGTGGTRGGAVGVLDCGTFEYGATIALSDVMWSVGSNCMYNGSEQRPVVGITQSGIRLVEGDDADYVISYSDEDNLVGPGVVHYTATAVEGEGKHFTGVFNGAFSIMPFNLSTADDVTLEYEKDYVVTDATGGVCPSPVVKVSGRELVENEDYTVSYLNNCEAGTATLFVNGTGNYAGTVSGTFTIEVTADVAALDVSGLEDATWTGAAIKRVPTVKAGDKVLVEGSDYTVAYLRDDAETIDFTSVGTVTVRIAGANDVYRGSRDLAYRIEKAENPFVVSFKDVSVTYSAGAQTVANPLMLTGAQGAVTYGKASGSDYLSVTPDGAVTVSAKTPAGAYSLGVAVMAAGNDNYNAKTVTAQVTVTIAQAANPLTVMAEDPAAVAYSVSKRTFANQLKATGAQGELTYVKTSGSKYLTVAKNGKITLGAKAPTGTHKLNVAAMAAGNTNYSAKSVTKAIKVKVVRATNTLAASTKGTRTAKFNKKVTFKAATVWKIAKNTSKGKVKYAKTSGSPKISVAKNGNITVAKGLKRGVYSVKVKLSTAKTRNYNAASKVLTLKVKVA